jgi:hemolysin activation/secretion protein
MAAGWRICVLALVVACAPFAAQAQVPSSEQPGVVRERFIEQPAPKARPSGPTIVLPSTVAPPGAASIKLHVDSIQVVGATIYSPAALKSLYADLVGRTVTLAQVYALAQKITAKYGGDGYVLSRAIVPPQSLEPSGAVVTIEVIEGYIDKVEWPSTLSRYRDFFSDYSAKITAERPANMKTVMRYLLLANDLPGFTVRSSFRASADNAAASTLVVAVAYKPLDASAQIDNRGTEARGPWEFNVSATANNLLGKHEALTATYAGATDVDELQYVALNYKQVLNSEGLTAFADGSYSWGNPGTDILKALQYTSQSLAIDLGLSYPVVRSRDKNLTLSGLAFMSDDKGDILAAPNSDDRLRGLRFKADFDTADSTGATTWDNITFSQGFEGLGSTENGNPLASRANGRVDFSKIEGTLSRIQPLRHSFSIKAAVEGQYALTPLLASEQCGYGGRDFGRAFDPSEITGDSCWSVSGELRYDLPSTSLLSTSQLYAFVDYGTVYNRAPSSGTPASQDGASAGFGLRLSKGHFSADVSASKPLTGRADDGWRYFLTAATHF